MTVNPYETSTRASLHYLETLYAFAHSFASKEGSQFLQRELLHKYTFIRNEIIRLEEVERCQASATQKSLL